MAKEYIEREAVLAEYDRQHKGPPGGARKIIAEFPAADVRPVVHAHWVNVRQEGVCSWTAECSNCWTRNDIPPVVSAHYCPSCGAVMDEEVDDG